MNEYCACGCGKRVWKPGGTWLRGHHPRPVLSLSEAVERYLDRCVRSGDCLVHPSRKRYGDVRYGIGQRMSAHRAVYTVKVGAISDGLVVRHRCDNPPCAEVRHLEIGSTAQNVHDIYERSRRSDDTWLTGEQRPNAVLTERLVAELRVRAGRGERLWDLAAEFDVVYQTMCSAIRGDTWAHMTQPPPVLGAQRKASSRSLAVLRPEDCIRAARLAGEGRSLADVGTLLGVSRPTAWKLARHGRDLIGTESQVS